MNSHHRDLTKQSYLFAAVLCVTYPLIGIVLEKLIFGTSHWLWAAYCGAALLTLCAISLRQISKAEQTARDYGLKLHNHAYYDQLTGLPNRLAMQKDLAEYLSTAERAVVFYMDIDNFKNINDFMSPALGDKLLVEMSKRLDEWLDEGCSAYRLSADEFVVFVRKPMPGTEVKKRAAQLVDRSRAPFDLDGNVVHITLSVGVALYPQHGSNTEEIVKHADFAMYKSKDKGGNAYTIYDPAMTQAVSDRLQIERCLRRALANNELEVYYQPEVSVKTNTIIGFEALLRWEGVNPDLCSIQRLIEIAESTVLIIPIGKWVLEKACVFAKRVQDIGYPDITISVNVSIIQLLQGEFAQTVAQTLHEAKLDPKCLILEITESVLMESYDLVRSELKALQDIGVKIALDDFGKGYSSLAYLKSLPIDTLKIDRSFVMDIVHEQRDRILTGQIISIAERLGLCVVAEGVELPEQLHYLAEHQCDNYQGFLFSPAIPEEQAAALLTIQEAAAHSET